MIISDFFTNQNYLKNNFHAIKDVISPSLVKKVVIMTCGGLLLSLIVKQIFYYLNSMHNSKLLISRGHFTHDQYITKGINITKKCFDDIVNSDANSGWEWIYLSQRDEIFTEISKKDLTGTCQGNCLALAKEIIRRGKILPAAELQEIENGDKFPKRAIGFQLTQHTCREIRERVDKADNTTSSERPSQLSIEEENTLGKRAKYFCYHRHIDCLTTYGLSFQEVANFPDEEFTVLGQLIYQSIPFEFARDEIFKQPDLKTGKDLIIWASTYGFPNTFPLPSDKKTRLPPIDLLDQFPNLIYPRNCTATVTSHEFFFLSHQPLEKSELIEKFPKINEPNFSGIFIVGGSKNSNDQGAGHALLLEVDNQENIFVLYDNNLGFYSGENLDDCLGLLNTVWDHYKFTRKEFHPYTFEKKVLEPQT